jgi:23S rRNA (guanosine2251-2'-O)-methyltransferase
VGELIEGRNAVLEALRSGMPLERILIAEGTKPNPALDEIARRARETGLPLDRIARRSLDSRSERGAHQGVAAVASRFAYTPLTQILDSVADKPDCLLIALDHITDAGNFGAIVRSAEVVGADGVITAKHRSASIGPGAYKSSAGALAWMPIAQEPNLVRALEAAKREGFWVAGATEHAQSVAWDAPLEGRLVLVMGAEGVGLSRLVEETCDLLVRLPVQGRVGSLNVAQATSVLAYEWVRRKAARG